MPAPRRPNPDKAIDAALALAAERRWRDVTLRAVAAEAGMGLADLRALFASKDAIVAAFVDRIDRKVIAGTDPEAMAEPVRDRLFDILTRRFEALRPHRAALGGIVLDALRTPSSGLAAGCRTMRSMSWFLETAGVGGAGAAGRLRCKALAAVWLATLPVFLRDDSDDLARTMARLDRALDRLDRIASRLGPCRGRAGRPTGEATPAAAP